MEQATMEFRYTILLFILIQTSLVGQSTFTSNATGIWTSMSSWSENSGANPMDSDGIPDANDTVIVSSSNVIALSSATTQSCYRLTILGSGTFTVSGASSVLNIGENFNISSSTANFNLSGSGATVDAVDMNLSAGTATLTGGTLSVTSSSGGLNISGGLMLLNNSSTLTVTENVSISGGELSTNSTSATFNVSGGDLIVSTGGTFDHNNGDVNIGTSLNVSGGIVTMHGDNNTTASTIDVPSVSISAGSATLNNGRLNVNVASGDGLTISGGTLRAENDHVITVEANTLISGGTYELRATGMNTPTHNSGGGISVAGGTYDMDAGTSNLGTVSTITVSSGTFSVDGSSSFFNGNAMSVTGGTSEILNMAELSLTGNLTIGSGATLTVATDFSIGGTSLIDGTLSFTGDNGSKVFGGDITVSSTGNWNNTIVETFNINANITNNGTWTGCSTTGCDYQLGATSGSISGMGPMTSMGTITIASGAQTYTNTNTGGLEITTNLDGGGRFVNGTNGRLEYQGSGRFTITTFQASATGNTVVMEGAGTQEIRTTQDAGNNYYNLIINNSSGDLTIQGETNVDNSLTLTNGDIVLDDFDLIFASGATITGGSSGSYIQLGDVGILRRLFSTNDTFTFPIGNTTDYLPLALTMNSATYGSGSYVDVDLNLIAHPNRDDGNTGSGGDDTGLATVDYLNLYYTLSANNITSPDFDVTYSYGASNVIGTTEANMVGAIYRLDPTALVLDWDPRGVLNPITNTVTIMAADAFGDLYAMDDSAMRLPIELISFEAKVLDDSKVRIEWKTSSEEGNDFFTIERSSNTEGFEAIGSIAGGGNSTSLLRYSYVDVSPLSGRSYYRLRQTDFNGNVDYTSLETVWVEDRAPQIQYYPNPVIRGEHVSVSFVTTGESKPVRLSLHATSGNSKKTKNSMIGKTGGVIEFPISPRTSVGLYFLMIEVNGQITRKPLLIN